MKIIFDRFRTITGKLSQAQVDAISKLIELDKQNVEIAIGLATHSVKSSARSKSDEQTISSKGYQLIKTFEGFRADAYLDTGGVWTIGYGTIRYPTGLAVKRGDKCTREQGERYLMNDCKWVNDAIKQNIKHPLTQNQYDALASFIYNIGATAFKSSTMLRLINDNKFNSAANEFDRWVFDNGRVIKGLVNRRAAEKELFLT